MATVTDLKRQIKNKSRINIYLDGEYFTSADEVALHRAGIKKDCETDEKALAELIAADDGQRAFDAALKYLSYRLRSKREISVYLESKGFGEGTVEDTVAKLSEYGYVDDEAFARLYVQSQRTRYGIKKIAYKLRELGISDEIIDGVCVKDDFDALTRIAQKYRSSHRDADDKRLGAYLLSKGFEWEAVKAILRENDYE